MMPLQILALAGALSGACIPVEEDHILGKHLASANPVFGTLDPAEPIGFTPAPGVRRRYSGPELRALAQRHRIPTEGSQFSEICFERPMETLRVEQIERALRDTIGALEVTLEIADFCRIRLPRGKLEFPKSGLGMPPGGSAKIPVIWRGRLHYSATHSVPVWAKVRVWVRRDRIVAVEPLPAGKPILPAQLRLETVDCPPFAPPSAASNDEIVGHVPRRSIAAGRPVSAFLLAAPNDVERGDTVAVEVRSGGAHLRFKTKAESAGYAGDMILLRNPDNNRRFRGRVTGRGTVVVEEDEPVRNSRGPNEVNGNAAGPSTAGAH